MRMQRRNFLKAAGATAGASVFAGCATVGAPAGPKVVIVGGGYGGATAAKYIKLFAPNIDVTIVERNSEFVSCPISNLVLGGRRQPSTSRKSRCASPMVPLCHSIA